MSASEAQKPRPLAPPVFADRIRAHIAIARIDHASKNVFILPGIIIALSVTPDAMSPAFLVRAIIGFIATCIIASSNYVINEILDAPYDRLHPIKCSRPVPSGLVHVPTGYLQWLGLMVLGLLLASRVNTSFFLILAGLWLMGCIYNIPPVRSKDVPYLDVLSESVNNPLRMLAGWYMVTDSTVPPLSLIVAYWMVGCYFMALKRFSEYREIRNSTLAGQYRKSFRYYTERSLLVSVMFYGSAAMLFFGAFITRYRLELVLSFPFVALVMAIYYHLAFDDNSCVQNPEHLHREKGLMLAVSVCAVVMITLLFYDIPIIAQMLSPTIPVQNH